MKKIKKQSMKSISLLLIFVLILSLALSLTSCANGGAPNTGGTDSDENNEPGGEHHYLESVIKPEYKDYGRGTVSFKEIVYTRPNFAALTTEINAIIAEVEKNELAYNDQLKKIEELDKDISGLLTMYTMARIYVSKNSSDEFWSAEYDHISKHYTSLVEKIEDLKVAAAKSPNALLFERDAFGEGFVENYKNGSPYSPAALKLIADENALEAEYNSLSTANIEITYQGKTDTTENTLNEYKEKYGEDSTDYQSVYTSCMTLYSKKHLDRSTSILTELFKVRKLLAAEMGYNTYTDYAMKQNGSDYTSKQLSKFIGDIAKYVLPVYISLYEYAFGLYFSTSLPQSITFDELLNNSHDVLKDTDSELYNMYCYMLQHGLFDIESKDANRSEGAYTTYLYDYSAPFIFMTGSENVTDYSTLFHEFGHFADFYTSGGKDSPLDISEISSQALELLMIDSLGKKLGEKYEQYLLYSSMKSALETLCYQGFYARFEELVYALDYNDITTEKINAQIMAAATEFSMNTEMINSLDDIFIPHFIVSPVYVHSYCTSIIPALEIFFIEEENKGAGFDIYKKVLGRDAENTSFSELIELAGLTSPFKEGYLKEIANKIHYKILGSNYYQVSPQKNAA